MTLSEDIESTIRQQVVESIRSTKSSTTVALAIIDESGSYSMAGQGIRESVEQSAAFSHVLTTILDGIDWFLVAENLDGLRR
jgi:hypothetical protein